MGALTLKSFSDELREWEFIESEGIDPTDSFGTSLRLSVRENQIFLAEPNDPEMPWLTDKGRLFFDGMFEQSQVHATDWKFSFQSLLEVIYFVDHLRLLHNQRVSLFIFAFENLSLENLNMLYLLKQNCSLIELKKVESDKTYNDFESYYQLGSFTQKPRISLSTLGILINTNLRHEGYVLNLNFRQRFLKGNFKILNVGSVLDFTFPVYNLGSNFNILRSISEGAHLSCQDIKNADFPLLITNIELFKRNDARVIKSLLKYVKVMDTAWQGTNVLNNNIGSVGIKSLNSFLPLSTDDFINFFGLHYINVSLNSLPNMKKLVELHLLGVNNFSKSFKNAIFVDQNSRTINKSFYDKVNKNLFNRYLYLPSNLFLEDSETYINTQGLIKRTTKLLHFKKNAKTNWQLIRKFYANTKSLLFFGNKKDNQLINFDSLNSFHFKNYVNFQFFAVQTLTSLSFYLTKKNSPLSKLLISELKELKIKVINTKIKYWLDDFFNGNGKDSFSYNSSVLINCSKISRLSSTNFF